MINVLNSQWDEEGQECLRKFTAIRGILAKAFNIEIQTEFELTEFDRKKEPLCSHDVVILEVSITTLYGHHFMHLNISIFIHRHVNKYT